MLSISLKSISIVNSLFVSIIETQSTTAIVNLLSKYLYWLDIIYVSWNLDSFGVFFPNYHFRIVYDLKMLALIYRILYRYIH